MNDMVWHDSATIAHTTSFQTDIRHIGNMNTEDGISLACTQPMPYKRSRHCWHISSYVNVLRSQMVLYTLTSDTVVGCTEWTPQLVECS